MSKHNYTQYSNKNKQNNPNNPNPQQKKTGPVESKEVEVKSTVAKSTPNNPRVEINPVVSEDFNSAPKTATPEDKMVEETVETVDLPEMVEGTVANCAKLNVRAKPNTTADVIYILDAMSEIEIDVAKSTNEWFYICTATGVEGYCMRKFIEAYL